MVFSFHFRLQYFIRQLLWKSESDTWFEKIGNRAGKSTKYEMQVHVIVMAKSSCETIFNLQNAKREWNWVRK